MKDDAFEIHKKMRTITTRTTQKPTFSILRRKKQMYNKIIIKNGKMGFINMQGEEIIKPEFDQVYPFEKGLARVENMGKLGLINEQGEILLDPIYDFIGTTKENLVIVTRNNKKGLIKVTGTAPENIEYLVDVRD